MLLNFHNIISELLSIRSQNLNLELKHLLTTQNKEGSKSLGIKTEFNKNEICLFKITVT